MSMKHELIKPKVLYFPGCEMVRTQDMSNANKATVSGSKQISASEIAESSDPQVFGGKRFWKIPCENKINQLYINDSYGIRARYPNSGEELRLLNMDI